MLQKIGHFIDHGGQYRDTFAYIIRSGGRFQLYSDSEELSSMPDVVDQCWVIFKPSVSKAHVVTFRMRAVDLLIFYNIPWVSVDVPRQVVIPRVAKLAGPVIQVVVA
jgi:hypothetical protein